ncbi:MAG: DUF3037 domain-containing protein [Candidatus Abyssobacteria bacterium SURF_5]|uniref:DUF3037 domain-containing protein n=1 Tax=Abyssobacteria bacterium (strain SURF_5) TaxID=2093360 RepID=A0A3A4NVL1_ABYX5|nr:MAG: DUF3037 domain-containing protein [Candidatus Abyssubacteria bacterium SURF_5]
MNSKCKYVIVRFVPDFVKGEFVNVGIVLECRERRFVDFHFSSDLARISRIFPNANVDIVRGIAKDLRKRLGRSGEEYYADLFRSSSTQEADTFLAKLLHDYSNHIEISQPKASLCDDPEEELKKLFQMYVTSKTKPEEKAPTHQRIVREFKRQFQEEKVLTLLMEQERVSGKGYEYIVDFAYRNGIPNYIETLNLAVSDDHKKNNTLRLIAESLDIRRKHKKAQFSALIYASEDMGPEEKKAVKSLQDFEINPYPKDKLGLLAKKIKKDVGDKI